jgi:hypothetical protein
MRMVFMQANASAVPTTGVVVPPTAALTGTMTSGLYESEIVAGGETLVITLTNSTWVAAGSTFDTERQNILNGIVSAQSEATGWNAVRSGLAVTTVVRTSNTVATITLGSLATYAITTNETITVMVPGTAVQGALTIVASPTLTIIDGVAGGAGNLWNFGFEDGTFGGLTNGGTALDPAGADHWTFSTSDYTEGSHSADVYGAYSAGGDIGVGGYWVGSGSYADIWATFDMKIVQRATSDGAAGLGIQKQFIFRAPGYGTQQFTMIQDDGSWKTTFDNGELGTNIGTIVVGTWQRWKFRRNATGTYAVVTIWVDGTQVYQGTDAVSVASKGLTGVLSFGGTLNAGSGPSNFRFDNVHIGTVDPG